MDTRVETIEPIRVIYLRAVGPYQKTFPVIWPKLRQFAGAHGLANATFLSIAHNNPRTTPPEEIVGDACVRVPDSFTLTAGDIEAGFQIQSIPAGRHFIGRFVGPYQRLAAAWGEFCDVLLPAHGHVSRPGLPFEIYRSDGPVETVTELYMPID